MKEIRFTNEEKSKLVFLGGSIASDIADCINYLLITKAGTPEQRQAAIDGMKRLKKQLAKVSIEPERMKSKT